MKLYTIGYVTGCLVTLVTVKVDNSITKILVLAVIAIVISVTLIIAEEKMVT